MKKVSTIIIKYMDIICSGIAGAVLFVLIYGVKVLNPVNTNWLMMGGDPTQHYLGFLLYKEAPFKLQAGMMNTASYPFSSSVMFTDSIPIAALTGKIIGQFTDKQFQYFGIWCFLCMILNAVMASIILRKYTDKIYILLPASAMFAISPTMLRRIFWHTSLSSHFLIMAGFVIIAYRKEFFKSVNRTVISWGIISFLCIMIHMYFLAMCGMVLFMYVLFTANDLYYSVRDKDLINTYIKKIIYSLIIYVLVAIITLWWIGGFSSGMNSSAPGLAYYSFNLNGFINPDGYSSIIPNMIFNTAGQYEGFAYLGAGCILKLMLGLILYGVSGRKAISIKKGYVIGSIIVFLIIILMSSSNEITFGNNVLLKYPVDTYIVRIWEIFRATGRLIWPAVYMLMLLGAILLIKSTKSYVAVVLLVLCFFLQLTDLSGIIERKNQEFNREVNYVNMLDGPFMDEMFIKRDIEHIVFLDKENLSQEELYAFAELAASKGLTINDFYFARALSYPIKEVALDFFMHPNENTLYVISAESAEMRYMFDIEFTEYNGLFFGLK